MSNLPIDIDLTLDLCLSNPRHIKSRSHHATLKPSGQDCDKRWVRLVLWLYTENYDIPPTGCASSFALSPPHFFVVQGTVQCLKNFLTHAVVNEWGCPHDAEVQRLAALLSYKNFRACFFLRCHFNSP
jgi:hypothetical protein